VKATFPVTSWAWRMMANRQFAFLESSRSVNCVSSLDFCGDLSVNELRQFRFVFSNRCSPSLAVCLGISFHNVDRRCVALGVTMLRVCSISIPLESILEQADPARTRSIGDSSSDLALA
jgi:hypothetical protein